MNPTVTIALSDKTTVDLSYEYADHERFIDRGIPTINNAPDESLSNIVFGDEDINVTTFEANIMRANVSHNFSQRIERVILQFNLVALKKCIRIYMHLAMMEL